MCLAKPGEVIEVKEDSVILDYGEEKREAKTDYLEPDLGDYVIVKSRQVIQKLSEEDVDRYGF